MRPNRSGRIRASARMSVVVSGALLGTLLQGLPAAVTAASADDNRPAPVSSERPAKGSSAKPKPARDEQRSRATRPKVDWPKPGTLRVRLPSGGAAAKTSVRAGKTAVTLGTAVPARGASADRAASRAAEADLRLLDRSAAERAGIDGVLLTLGNATAGTTAAPLKTRVTVDYSGFARAAGGDYGSRLQLVRMPDCVLTTPEKPECRIPTPLAGRNDAEAKTVTADAVAVPPAAPAGMQAQLGGATATVLAATAGSASLAGDFKASPLAPSSSWNTELNTGTFTTSYGMAVPSVPGSFVPKVSLNYSSGTLDGRTSNSNNQASWAGDGFDMSPGFVERAYKPCADEGVKKDDIEIGDLCWGYDNATISFAGHSGELIPVGADEWRLKGDDSTKVTRVKDTTRGNGDNDGEYFKAVTSDGTTYWFGSNRLDNWATGKPETKSVFTVPVYGNNAGEQCYNADIKSAWCQQGWRWNLDKAVDTKGNVITYWYNQEANSYGRYLTAADDTPYVRGGTLDHIEYGQKATDIYSATAKPMARVNFATAERCLETDTALCDPAKIDANRQYWYDTPWDMNCKAGTDCDAGRFSPTFFTRTRLAAVTTQTLQSDGTYKDIDAWTLKHRWGSSDIDYQLILSSIVRKGLAGTTPITLPATVLGYDQLPNRLDKQNDGRAPFIKERLSSVTDEAGGQIDVNYSAAACSWSALPTPQNNTTRCFPQQYQPSNKMPVTTEWFNKYVVDSVIGTDLTGGSPDMVTRYTYLGDAAWAFDDDDGLTKEKLKTWSQWRGYQHTRVQTGGTLQMLSQADHWFLRGMDGDRDDPADKSKTRTVTASDGVGGTITDDQAWAGYEYRVETYDAPGGKILSKTVSTPWKKETAKRVRDWGTTTANITSTETSRSYTSLDGGAGADWREVRSKNFFDAYGRVTKTENSGDVAVAADDTCTRTTYADNTSAWILTGVVRKETVAANCSATVDRDTQPDGTSAVLSDVRTRYDGQAYGVAPTKGLPTMVETLKQRTGTKATYLDSAATFDGYGRPLTATELASTSVFDPAEGTAAPVTTAHAGARTTTTAYTPATGRLTKTVVTTPPATVGAAGTAQTSTTYYDTVRGLPTTEDDTNGLRTSVVYDALGRDLKLWKPDRSKASNQTPNIEYRYHDDAGQIRSVEALTLNSDASQASSWVLYDGFGRERQTQAPGDNGGRLLTDNFYDARGNVERSHATYYATKAPSGELFKLEDATGVETQTTTEYDGLSRPTRVTQLTGSGIGGKVLSTTSTVYGGDRVTVTPPQGGTTTTSISDAAGRVTELLQYRSREPAGPADSTTYEYDPAGHLVKLTDPSKNDWTWTYDQLGRQRKSTDPDSGTSTKYYNDRGELTSSEDGRRKTTAFRYDNLSRQIESREDSSTGPLLTSQTWDPTGNKGKLGSASRYVKVGAGTYEYKSTVNVYDALYRPTRTTLNVPSVPGQEALAGSYVTGVQYSFDGSVKSLAYPAAGSLPAETLAFTYDALRRRVTASSLASGYLANQTYSLTGKPLQSTLNAGGKNIWISNEWEWGTQRLTGSRTDLEGGNGAERAAGYTYDEAGNVTSLSDISRYGEDRQCFAYDYVARLTEAYTSKSTPCPAQPSASDLGGPAPYWTSWTYNTDGTRKTETEHDPTGNAAADKVRTYAYPATGEPRRHSLLGTSTVTGGAGDPVTESYAYDAGGNTTERHLKPEAGTTSDQILDWDYQGKLTKLTDTVKRTADGLTVTTARTSDYVYGPDGGRLLSHDVDSATPETESTTLYLGTTELKLTKGAAKPTATRYYDLGTAVAVRTDDNRVSFQVTDHHNTGTLDIDASGAVVDQRRMTPFGEQRGAAPSGWAGSRGFVGGTMDPTGLTHLGAREYDPTTGRFISIDPVLATGDIQSLNGYAYSNNNPMTLSDPSGLRPDGICGGNSSTCRPSDSGNEMSVTYHESWQPTGSGWKWSNYVENKKGKRYYTYGGVNWGTVVDLTPRKIKWNVNTALGALRSVVSSLDLVRPTPFGPSATESYDAFVNLVGGDTSDPAYEDGEGLATAVGLVFTGVGGAGKGAAKATKKALPSCPNSFTEGTEVLLADGTSKPIEDVRVGDKVVATDAETGETRVETVTAEIKGQGLKHLVKVTIDVDGKAGSKTAKVTATEGHPFWVPELQAWIKATDLKPGQWLRTSAGTFVQVTAVERWTNPDANVRNLTVSELHTYYVLAGATPVLVHNCNTGPRGFPARSLPRNKHGEPVGDPAADGYPHTVLGQKKGRRETYAQAREFDAEGKPVKDVDFTDHGRPRDHDDPHQHPYNENSTGGSRSRGEAEPLEGWDY
ncbi:RHS repeat-associated core domain-containing protein [Streptomyces sp. NPDC048018]|uniref:RHS repeat-associated core domain-containing protein n=1 Tax=Streptomyces sp. NPDC048018 TaxID=3365499 RepID=UPI003712973D